MISCEEALELISLELDGLLDREDKLQEHLARCASCRQLREDLGAIHQALPALEAEPPEDLVQRVLGELKPVPPRKRFGLRGLAGVAACAVLCIGLWQLRPAPEPSVALTADEGPSAYSETAPEPEGVQPELALAAPRQVQEEAYNQEACKSAADGEALPEKGRLPTDCRSNIWPVGIS